MSTQPQQPMTRSSVVTDFLGIVVNALGAGAEMTENGLNLSVHLAWGTLAGQPIKVNMLDDDDKEAVAQVLGVVPREHAIWRAAQVVREEVPEQDPAGMPLSEEDVEDAKSSLDEEDLEGDEALGV
jgi:hypothetical protein